MKIIAQSDVITLASVNDGIGISSVVPQYYLSTSETETINGIWSYEQPVWSPGHYIWTRSEITNSDNEVTYTTPIVATALNSANKAASDASTKADSAYDTAESASDTANTASTTAAEAKTIASTANETSAQANTKAEKAQSDAAQAIKTSNDAKDGVAAVNQDISSLKTTVDGMNTDISTAQQNITKNANAITGINQKLSTDYATKTEVSDTKASLETEISTSASNLAASVKETYASKSDVSTIQGELENKIQVNTDGLSATSKKVTSLESQTGTISQNLANAAKTAENAQKNAQTAIANAKAAQDTADTAVSNAKAAGDKATEAQNQLNAAKKNVADADAALKTAKDNYDAALSAYNSVSADPKATAVQIEAAKEKLDQAQTALNKALADVLTANHDVTDAQTAAQDALNNAVTAYQNAETAMKDAKTAQDTADKAVASAKKANEDLAALTSKVTEQGTKIEQNSESITSLASRTTTVENKFTGYYTKTEADSAIKQKADSITSSVSQTYETKTDSASKLSSAKSYTDNKLKSYSTTTQMTSAINQKADSITSEVKKVDQKIDDLQVGGRNLILHSSFSGIKRDDMTTNYNGFINGTISYYNGNASLHTFSEFSDGIFMDTIVSDNAGNVGIMFGREANVFETSKQYTFSVWAKSSSTKYSLQMAVAWKDTNNTRHYVGGLYYCEPFNGVNKWQFFKRTLTLPSDAVMYGAYIGLATQEKVTYSIRQPKLELGNQPTDWSPAPEDVTAYTDSKIKQTSDSITATVSKKVGKDEVISSINQTPESVTINANKININGTVSANGNFKVDTSGNLTATSATLKNCTISGHLDVGTTFSDGTNVKTAISNAQSTAAGKNKTVYSENADPSATTGYVSGDTWFNKATGGIWQFDGKAWKLHQVGTTSIKNGAITTDKITVDSLSAISANLGTVTAGTISGVNINGSNVYTNYGSTFKVGNGHHQSRVRLSSTGLYYDLQTVEANNVKKYDGFHKLVYRSDDKGTTGLFLDGSESDITGDNKIIERKDLLTLVYPVGSIYMSVNSTSPASFFGGSWERLKDRFLLAAGNTYAAGRTGGEAYHKLTVNEMPSHTHGIHLVAMISPQGGGSDQNFGVAQVALGNQQSGSAGGNGSHNNMPPFLAVYVWKRVR